MSRSATDNKSNDDDGETEIGFNYDDSDEGTDDSSFLQEKGEIEMESNYDSDATEGDTLIHDSQSDEKNNNCKNISRKSRKTKRLNVKRTYGLRPRTQLRRPSYDCDTEEKEHQQISSKKDSPKHKVRGTIVAKYRRLTANARERQRMKEINTAFMTLQGVLPVLENRRHPSGSASTRASMTKIRTLRHAASYIQALSDLLSSGIEKEKEIQHSYATSLVTSTTTIYQTTSPTSPHLPTTNLLQHPITSYVNHPLNPPNQPQLNPEASAGTLESQENALSWENVQTTDEELFSLLEKEVLCMRKGTLNDENNPNLGGINWSDDLPPLG